jgi:WD40 repeat protein
LFDNKTKDFKLLSAHKGEVLAVMFSRDSRWLASASKDKTVRIWDPARQRVVRTLKGHRDHVLSIAFSPDGKLLASGSKDKTIKLWNAESGAEIRTLGFLQSGMRLEPSPHFPRGGSLGALGVWRRVRDEQELQ